MIKLNIFLINSIQFTHPNPQLISTITNHSKYIFFNTYFFTDYDIFELLNKLPRSNNYCPDGIPFIFLKNYAQTLATPIAQLLRHLIFTGIIPERWKYAIVLPLFKNKGNETPVIITDH